MRMSNYLCVTDCLLSLLYSKLLYWWTGVSNPSTLLPSTTNFTILVDAIIIYTAIFNMLKRGRYLKRMVNIGWPTFGVYLWRVKMLRGAHQQILSPVKHILYEHYLNSMSLFIAGGKVDVISVKYAAFADHPHQYMCKISP